MDLKRSDLLRVGPFFAVPCRGIGMESGSVSGSGELQGLRVGIVDQIMPLGHTIVVAPIKPDPENSGRFHKKGVVAGLGTTGFGYAQRSPTFNESKGGKNHVGQGQETNSHETEELRG